MKKYIIDGPKYYPRQTVRRYCAMYSTQSIVERFTGYQGDIFSYASTPITRFLGLMFPTGIVDVLRRHGVSCSLCSYRRKPSTERMMLLKEKLQKGYPITLLIAPGYGSRFSFLKAIIFQHYVTVWGYDDEKQVFYVYDSGKHVVRDPNIPVGTIAVPYSRFMRYRNRGGLGFYKNLAIQIDAIG